MLVCVQLSASLGAFEQKNVGTSCLGHRLWGLYPSSKFLSCIDLKCNSGCDMTGLPSQDIRKVWVSYAALTKKPSTRCQEKLLDRIEMDIASYSNSQLAQCMRVWCALGITPKPALLSQLQMVRTSP